MWKKIISINSIKYLDVKIDRELHWHDQVNIIKVELNRANALLLKIRNYVNIKTLRNIYFLIFDSHLSYSCVLWIQNVNTIRRFIILPKKALQVMNVRNYLFHSSPLFTSYNILKFCDKITLEIVLFISKSSNRPVLSIFHDIPYTRPNIPIFWTLKYGRCSVRASATQKINSKRYIVLPN